MGVGAVYTSCQGRRRLRTSRDCRPHLLTGVNGGCYCCHTRDRFRVGDRGQGDRDNYTVCLVVVVLTVVDCLVVHLLSRIFLGTFSVEVGLQTLVAV